MSNQPKKILVTGGCGFLGSNIASYYLGLGTRVIVIDALFRTGGKDNLKWLHEKAPKGHFRHIFGDLADHEMVERVFKEEGPFDYICHLGGQVAMTTSLTDPRRDMLTNVTGTFNVLEAARKLSPDALVAFSSTNKVYGDLEDFSYEETNSRYILTNYPEGLDESIRLDFASPYGCSKGAADQYVHDWHRNYGLKTVVFRHSSIYGGRQFSTVDQGWIGWFCKQAMDQGLRKKNGLEIEPFTISGSGKQVRDVLHATDLVSLYDTVFQNQDKVAGQVYNIGGGVENSLSLLELFGYLAELTNQNELSYTKLAPRQSDQKVFIADTRKIKEHISWEPAVTAKEGIQAMLGWISEING